jgi:hypothetical protein
MEHVHHEETEPARWFVLGGLAVVLVLCAEFWVGAARVVLDHM